MKLITKIKTIPPVEKMYNLIVGGFLMLLVLPVHILFPRKKKQMILLGTSNGLFIDNVKYFFLHLERTKPDLDYYFITSNPEVYQNLNQHFNRILFYPKPKTIWVMLRSNIVVMDNTVLDQKLRFVFVKGAKHIQLWHGIGIKKMWKESTSLSTRLLRPYFRFIERKRTFDSFISTSEFFTQNCFQPVFQARNFPATGYPRNDILWQENPVDDKIMLETDRDCLEKIQEFKEQGTKVLIYMPTFRGTRGRGDNSLKLDLSRLNQFAQENNLLFILKLHPILSNQGADCNFERILWHKSSKDVYPLLFHCDAMITDYSSIFMDYMILDRPVLFYMYDKQEYENRDQLLVPFYQDCIIGDISFTQEELERDILHAVFEEGNKSYNNKREAAMKFSYEYQDACASERILNHIMEKYINE